MASLLAAFVRSEATPPNARGRQDAYATLGQRCGFTVSDLPQRTATENASGASGGRSKPCGRAMIVERSDRTQALNSKRFLLYPLFLQHVWGNSSPHLSSCFLFLSHPFYPHSLPRTKRKKEAHSPTSRTTVVSCYPDVLHRKGITCRIGFGQTVLQYAISSIYTDSFIEMCFMSVVSCCACCLQTMFSFLPSWLPSIRLSSPDKKCVSHCVLAHRCDRLLSKYTLYIYLGLVLLGDVWL